MERIFLPQICGENILKMFELDEIMRQRESKRFAEIFNQLREGNYTPSDLAIIHPEPMSYRSTAIVRSKCIS